MKITIYKDKKKELRWRMIAKNGRILADSGEGYKRISALKHSLNVIYRTSYDASDILEAIERYNGSQNKINKS
jgi:uncharacterized protein YegP (UPF0339 family)